MLRIYTPTPLLVLLLTVWLAACSTREVQVESAWEKNAPRNQSFSQVLVIGVSPNVNGRCQFEKFMVSQLRSASINAKASCNVMKTSEPLTLENIGLAVDEYGADSVLATTLVASAVRAREGGTADTRGGGYYKPTGTGYASPYYYGGYGAYGVPVVYVEFETAPVVTTLEGEVSIQSMLYATHDASLVYTLTTTATDLYSREAALSMLTAPIADRLVREGLIHSD
jgi:hypothetical protein